MKQWYAVHCRPRQDARAETHLRNQGFASYRPLARLRRRRGGRVVNVVESLFPRYLFVHLDGADTDWSPIRSTRGVVGLVRWGDCVPVVPERVIAAIQARADPDSGVIDLDLTAGYRANQPVRITEGPFAECEALFQGRAGEERVVVLIEIMHQAQRLTLSGDAITPV